MPNKAFKAATRMSRSGLADAEVLHALGVAKVHTCVLDEVRHRLERRNVGKGRGKSQIEIIGHDYRLRRLLPRKQ